MNTESARSQRFERQLEALNSIAATVSESLDLDALLQSALAQVLHVTQLRAGWLFLYEPLANALVLRAQQGLSPQFADEEASLPFGECACAEVLHTGEARIVSNIVACPRLRPSTVRTEGLRAHASVPLSSNKRVLGVLNVASDQADDIAAVNLQLLTAIGRYVGIAIENAQSIDRTRRERATLRSVMDSMVDGLILVDTEGRISYWNPRATEYLGISPSTVTGKPAMGLARRIALYSTQPDKVSEQLAEALLHYEDFPVIEYELLRPHRRTVQSLLFPIMGDQEEPLGYGMTLRDVSREKESDRMKLQLLSTVSHELRTPLASIKGFATTLLRDDVEWDQNTQREFVEIIDQESDRLSELIGNLLDMSRLETGTLRIEKGELHLRALLSEAIETMRMHTARHQFSLESPTHVHTLLADHRRIRQVIHNLLENAIKYSPQGGLITIRVEQGSGSVTVHVKDQGMGIPSEYHSRVFDRFFQADSASTREIGGSGLGLAISRSIIEAHGGRMWFESQVGQGSTFSFSLPAGDQV